MKLSIVTTLYKSEEFIEEFIRRIQVEAGKIASVYEIIMVDDGSPDSSLEIALRIQKICPQLRIIELSRNFGHHKAMVTGLENASGDLIFLIDVDLEEAPELLTVFDSEMKATGCDVVFGVQKKRNGGIIKRIGGRIGWSVISMMLPMKIPVNSCTVRLMTRSFVQALVRHKEHMTAIAGLWVISGFNQKGILIDKSSREQTSYSFMKRLRMLLDGVTSFSERPLYFILFLGCGIFFTSLLVAASLIYQKLTGTILSGWASVMVSVWCLAGVILLCLGIVGLYISRIFIETKMRPYVIIKKIYGA